jgi:hypothetical protein
VELACKEILIARLGPSPSGRKSNKIYNAHFNWVLAELQATPTDPAAALVARHAQALQRLGRLRNHLIHEGRRVLFYSALDRLFGKDVLPFVAEAATLPRFANLAPLWRHPPLHCGIDPLTELVRHFGSEAYDPNKTAYLKELGRAAYESPLYPGPMAKYFNDRLAARYRALAVHSLDNEANIREVRTCPVCGVESLLVSEERDYEPDEDGGATRAWWYTWEAGCVCCSFEVEHHLGNASAHGIGIEDYWEGGDL